MRFNVSEVIDYDNCPTLHRLRWLEKKGSPSIFALDLGTAVHKSLRQIILGEARDKVEDLVGKTISSKDLNQARAMDIILDHWATVPRTWEVLESEEVMEIEVMDDEGRPFILYGTPDLVVKWGGKTWHVQHKTLAATRPVWTYVQEIRCSLHEGLYGEMIERKYGNYAGTMLNVVRKISLSAASINPSSGMHMEFMPISSSLRSSVIEDLKLRKNDLERSYNDPGRYTYKRRKHCMGVYGNSPCFYYETCHGSRPGSLGKGDAKPAWPSPEVAAPVGPKPDDIGNLFIEGQDFGGEPVGW